MLYDLYLFGDYVAAGGYIVWLDISGQLGG